MLKTNLDKLLDLSVALRQGTWLDKIPKANLTETEKVAIRVSINQGRFWREEAGKYLTDAEFATWQKSRRKAKGGKHETNKRRSD